MKRFKTWERWDLAFRICKPTGPFRLFSKKLGNDEDPYIVMQQADYRKMKAVFDAAMRWSEVYVASDELDRLIGKLADACAKAAKP